MYTNNLCQAISRLSESTQQSPLIKKSSSRAWSTAICSNRCRASWPSRCPTCARMPARWFCCLFCVCRSTRPRFNSQGPQDLSLAYATIKSERKSLTKNSGHASLCTESELVECICEPPTPGCFGATAVSPRDQHAQTLLGAQARGDRH